MAGRVSPDRRDRFAQRGPHGQNGRPWTDYAELNGFEKGRSAASRSRRADHAGKWTGDLRILGTAMTALDGELDGDRRVYVTAWLPCHRVSISDRARQTHGRYDC